MSKIIWKAGNMLYPLPAVLVSCGTIEKPNIITIAWTGTVNTNPPMVSISVRKERFSYDLIKSSGAFVINLPTKELVKAVDWCGVRSGKDYDKFKSMNLTPIPSSTVEAPAVQECPVNIECTIKQAIELGSHTMFIAEITAVQAEEKYLDKNTGKFDLRQTEPIAYLHGSYYTLGENLGRFGFSVRKKRNKRKDSEKEI